MSQGYPPPPNPGGQPQWGTPQPFGNPSPHAQPAAPYGTPQPASPYGPPGPSQPPPGYPPASPYGRAAQPPGYGPPTRPPAPPTPPPDNFLVWAVLSTVFCCFLAGIPALLAATSVNERWLRGDHAGAREASLRARNWTIGAVLLGVIFWTSWMVGVFVLGWKDTLGEL